MWADFTHKLMHASCVGDIAVMKVKVFAWQVIIVMQVINTATVEGARSANDAVHLIALFQELTCHVGAVLTRHACDERALCLCQDILRPNIGQFDHCPTKLSNRSLPVTPIDSAL